MFNAINMNPATYLSVVIWFGQLILTITHVLFAFMDLVSEESYQELFPNASFFSPIILSIKFAIAESDLLRD